MIVTFNDTIIHKTITNGDLGVKIYGPESDYNFTWSAVFTQAKEMMIYLSIESTILGNKIEEVQVEFNVPKKFVSSISKRSINISKQT